jgi:hypothetical protein
VGVLIVGALAVTPLGFIWLRLPRFESNSNVIHIYVARLWDREGLLGVSPDGESAQQAIKEAIEEQAQLVPALQDRVQVRSLNRVISPEDFKAGAGRARQLASRGNADIIVWGSVLQSPDEKHRKYYVRVTSAEKEADMRAFLGPTGIPISQDPAPPELSQQPLALGCFVLGYASYDRRDFTSALTFFTTLADTKEWWADRPQRDKDRAALTFWIADCGGVE